MRKYKGAVQVLVALGIFIFLLHPGRFSCSNYQIIADIDMDQNLVKDPSLLSKLDQKVNCSPSVIYPKAILQDIIESKNNIAKTGGLPEPPKPSSPSTCPAKYTSYIIVPYRDRETHLQIFLQYFHIFLQAQNVNYIIVIVEQRPNYSTLGLKKSQKLISQPPVLYSMMWISFP